ncbi:MAG: hypothetical protein M3M98_08555, partial [Nitrospirota bacterium]|nr:hypothetical protein [Nitrospirota bacterium]
LNPVYMDPYDSAIHPEYYEEVRNTREDVLLSLGQTRRYAGRIPLQTMTPRTDLCSTHYCLVDPGEDYLVYAPAIGVPDGHASIDLDLQYFSGVFLVEWFNPRRDRTQVEHTRLPSGRVRLAAPFEGDAVLYVHRSRR